MLKRAAAIVVVAALLAGALFYSRWRQEPLKVSGFIEADEIRLGSRVGGRVLKVHVQEGQAVETGTVLIELDPYDLQERRAEAAALLAARQAEYQRLAAGFRAEEVSQAQAKRDQLAAKVDRLKRGPRKQEIAAAQARVEIALAQQELAQNLFNSAKRSFESRAVSSDEMFRTTEDLKATTAAVDQRRQELDQLKEGTRSEEIAEAEAQLREAEAALKLMQSGYRKEEIASAKAAVEAAQASLSAIDRQTAEVQINAPVNGVVEALELQPGDLVAPNAPVMSLMDIRHLWVRAYVPENRLNLRVGQKLPISVDSFPDRKFNAHISYIARQGEFTPGNVQTPEERSKQVFRFKATLDEGLDVLRPGMAADVWLGGIK